MNINEKVKKLLAGESENHILPFFWQHGEEETVLRNYMKVIYESGCGAVCVESRPHPDFCGPKWWADMDVILDEARKREMKVWILDDSHFPTGFANGAVRKAPLKQHRQSICVSWFETEAGEMVVEKDLQAMIPPKLEPIGLEQYVLPSLLEGVPHYEDDELLSVIAVKQGTKEAVSLEKYVEGNTLRWEKPEGVWKVWVTGLSRNCGPHREYINMLHKDSCRILLDSVYEPHWQHYREDFGKTIAGFFSDEPELGNGHLYFMKNILGTEQDLPFSSEMAGELEKRLGDTWKNQMYLLWDDAAEDDEKAKVRYAYMDSVTKLVQEDFSLQIGDWCRSHGVQYIGHMIEDDNAHARTGSSLGHYFRGLAGQDMAGIDDIGGQVLPQGEDEPTTGNLWTVRDGEFYHYMLGALAASAAAIEPKKNGRSVCEIFGNYGWAEGVQMEKYLADHFMVRGINHFVPHAFSSKPFPDPDCPPHFFANGHNPQYRHFGSLIRYMNRVCTLISDGNRQAEVAVLYHGEAEWTGKAMLSQKPARKLAEAQIGFDIIPADVFSQPERYHADFSDGLTVNKRKYKALIIPYAQYITAKTAEKAGMLLQKGFPVLFLEGYPEGICDGDREGLAQIAGSRTEHVDNLVKALEEWSVSHISVTPANTYLRIMHYQNEQELYFLVNESTQVYRGTVQVTAQGPCYVYDPWENCCYSAVQSQEGERTSFEVELEPRKSMFVIFGDVPDRLKAADEAVRTEGNRRELKNWERSFCKSIAYPSFGEKHWVTTPDKLEEKYPEFSGIIRYETQVEITEPGSAVLEITDAAEGVEVFLNEKSLGIQIVPSYRYDLTPYLKKGENALRIEVATTLERECYELMKEDLRAKVRGLKEPSAKSGITGQVFLYLKARKKDEA